MIPLSLALAAVIGFAIQKGGLCAVLAVREVLDERRAGRFIAFFVGVAVVVVISAPLRWDGALPAEPAQHYRIAVLTGAALFGIGAVVNGTCAFGSIAHLGRGETSFLAMPAGLAIGFFIADLLPPAVLPVPLPEAHALAVPTLLSLTVVGAAAAAVCIPRGPTVAGAGARTGSLVPPGAAALADNGGSRTHRRCRCPALRHIRRLGLH